MKIKLYKSYVMELIRNNKTNEKLIIFKTSPNKSRDVFSAIMCLVTGQQFCYSHNLPHTRIIMEVHRKPDLLATASFALNDNHPFSSHFHHFPIPN